MRLLHADFESLPYCEVVFFSRMLTHEKYEKQKQGMLYAAFSSWLSGAGGKKSWASYCKRLGLVESEKIKPEVKKRMAEKSLATADRILKMFRDNK